MSRDLSVIIPARNEEFLTNTIDSVLETSVMNTEVIAILDGYETDLSKYKGNNKVTIVHNKESIGQRQATNQGVTISNAKFIMKLDAHCSLGPEFDKILMESCEYNWTVIPRMYVLDAFHWVCDSCRKEYDQGPVLTQCVKCGSSSLHKKIVWKIKRNKATDYMWIDKDLRMRYFDSNGLKPYGNNLGELKTKYSHKFRDWAKGDITDVMCCIGACWFLHRDRYWDIGGMDENHGSWGQMAVELAMKSFLSGGRQVVNKKTWFSHLPRTQPGFTWPYPMSSSQQEKARRYSKDLWMNDKWPQAKYKLKDFIDWFSPLPGWNNKREDLTILYYTANKIDETFANKIRDQIRFCVDDTPIISASQKPILFGENICVGEIGASLENVYRQVLEGAKKATTTYVALCEDDVLYTPDHFDYRPINASFIYNLNRWNLHIDRSFYSYRERCVLSQCIAVRTDLIKCLEERFSLPNIPKEYCGEPGIFEHKLNLPRYKFETFKSKEPNVVVFHDKDTSGAKRVGKQSEPKTYIEPWGEATDIIHNLFCGNIKPVQVKERKVVGKRSQVSFIKSKVFEVDEIYNNHAKYADPRKKESHEWFIRVFRPFIEAVHKGVEFTNEELEKLPYFEYLVSKLNPVDRTPVLKSKGRRHVIGLMRDGINVYNDIKQFGMKSPLDMWIEKDRKHLTLFRGGRRLEILKVLGYTYAPTRIFKSKDVFRKLNPGKDWKKGDVLENSIHNIAMKQFMKLGHLATDKYWVHDYTKLYDKEIGYLRNKPVTVLEIGVKRGASLKLWKDVFSKDSVIYGVDVDPKIKIDGFKIFHGSQADKEFLKQTSISVGKPFDLIVDDGSHIPKHQLASIEALWPYVSSQGIYVIEDMHWNYRADLDKCAINKTKEMIDYLYTLDVASVSFYYNIVFIRKL